MYINVYITMYKELCVCECCPIINFSVVVNFLLSNQIKAKYQVITDCPIVLLISIHYIYTVLSLCLVCA